MAQTIRLLGAVYSDVPAVELPTETSTAKFYDVSDTTAVASDVLQGKYFYTANGVRTAGTGTGGGGGGAIVVTDETDAGGGIIKHITAVDLSSDTVTASHLEQGYTAHDSNGNAITGTLTPSGTYQTKSVTPTESTQTVTPDTGYDALSSVEVGAISSTYVGTGITRRSSTDLTASGATVTVPSGYYSTQASKSVTSGTAGTPTATKGTVSNNSVTVTPSVTNTTGYITGGTKTGTAVTVSASELVSGSQTITSNNTYDVTNLASVVVNVSGGGGKAFQWYHGGARVNTSSYTATTVTLTVAKSGTYNISWSGFRNTTSGTSGSQLYKNGTAVGSAQTTFTDSYWQAPLLTNQSLSAGDVLVVRARARNTSYYMCVANLIIEEV